MKEFLQPRIEDLVIFEKVRSGSVPAVDGVEETGILKYNDRGEPLERFMIADRKSHNEVLSMMKER